MKNIVSPKHLTQLSDSWVLWFETSNQYLVVSNATKALLDVFLNSASEQDFKDHLKSAFNLSENEASVYCAELSEFLEAANTSITPPPLDELNLPAIKTGAFIETYHFGKTFITVRYGSSGVRNLIHPQWAHTSLLEDAQATTIFDIFKQDTHLYLFKNEEYINHYPARDFHFLQGQFALQLINTLYHKDESDWLATFHASTVCNDKEAIMIIGDSGNGKSTLSAVLMANGFDVLADDFTPLSAQNSEVYRFPSGISVKQGAFDMLHPLFPAFDQFPISKSSSKNVNIKYIPPIKSFGQALSHFPCRKIVYVKYDAQATSELKTVGIDKILETLIPESWLSPLAANAERFLDWLKEVQCFELHYSDNTTAVSQFKKLFAS